jgi:hypothetical protein
VTEAAFYLALAPALMFIINVFFYRRPPEPLPGSMPRVSILIPARNEEGSIEAAVRAALASDGVEAEVVVLDDHSEDRTAEVVRSIGDPRVRLESAPPLPEGWCGKQHACHVLASRARHPLLLFLDADVRLEADGAARMAAFLEQSGADLVSGVPRQVTSTLFEKLVIPLIHFILLGFLPIPFARMWRHPAFAAGCGQLFLARAEAYHRLGGHSAIRQSLHDGVTLPRAFRAAGLRTDLCDATGVAWCRMYQSAGEAWSGLAKNATEGLGSARMILPASAILLGGQVLPFVAIAWSPSLLAGAAVALANLPRLLGVLLFRQPLLGALLHPVGVVLLVVIQWHGLVRSLLGLRPAWRGRSYPAA